MKLLVILASLGTEFNFCDIKNLYLECEFGLEFWIWEEGMSLSFPLCLPNQIVFSLKTLWRKTYDPTISNPLLLQSSEDIGLLPHTS